MFVLRSLCVVAIHSFLNFFFESFVIIFQHKFLLSIYSFISVSSNLDTTMPKKRAQKRKADDDNVASMNSNVASLDPNVASLNPVYESDESNHANMDMEGVIDPVVDHGDVEIDSNPRRLHVENSNVSSVRFLFVNLL